jgi:hypothetical protein
MLPSPSKFGGASAYFDGLGSNLWLADSEDFNFGSGDFTIEGWTDFVTTGAQWICAQSDHAVNSNVGFGLFYTSGLMQFWYTTNGTTPLKVE